MKKLGHFPLGRINCEVWLNPDEMGGSFTLAPDDNAPRLIVGCAYDYWQEVLMVMTHEALEAILTLQNLRFKPCSEFALNHEGYVFHFNHQQFGVVCDELALFLAKAEAKVQAAWRKLRKTAKP